MATDDTSKRTAPSRTELTDGYQSMQHAWCKALERIDGHGAFGSDTWERPGGGGGITRILVNGDRIEKAAVNVSAVWGETPDRISDRMASAGATFFATGISIIVHPRNPYAPTFHANLRYLETDEGARWFGGGADLTPYYLFEDDAVDFHRTLFDVCARHSVADHAAWKAACDDYFQLPHRDEARGIGGIFFDHLAENLGDVWAFQQDCGSSFRDAYLPILERRTAQPYGEREVSWHRLRRGRYVEFNLVWDRGTRFGLETGGRTESILASLPPSAQWEYDHAPPPESDEAALLSVLQAEPRPWI